MNIAGGGSDPFYLSAEFCESTAPGKPFWQPCRWVRALTDLLLSPPSPFIPLIPGEKGRWVHRGDLFPRLDITLGFWSTGMNGMNGDGADKSNEINAISA